MTTVKLQWNLLLSFSVFHPKLVLLSMVWSNYMQSLEQFKKLKFPCKTPFVSCLHMPNLSPQADPFFTFCTQFCLKVAVFTKEGMGNRQKKKHYMSTVLFLGFSEKFGQTVLVIHSYLVCMWGKMLHLSLRIRVTLILTVDILIEELYTKKLGRRSLSICLSFCSK